MSEEGADEVISRLGGPSKIAKLEKALDDAVFRLDRERDGLKNKLTKALRYNRVTIGAELYLSENYGSWHGTGSSGPSGTFEIVALGHEWVVVRGTGNINKGEIWCRVGWNVREDIAQHVSPDVDLET